MKTPAWIKPGILFGALFAAPFTVLGLFSLAASANPPESEAKDKAAGVPLSVAKDRAKLMQEIYTSTLEVIHHRYFRNERTMVPARAMEDIFTEMQKTTNTEARWFAVNLKPMSLTHEIKTEFEKRAAKEIGEGKTEVETVEDGFYRRAVAIPLGIGCVGCHEGFFKPPSKDPKFAGLVVSIPIAKPAK